MAFCWLPPDSDRINVFWLGVCDRIIVMSGGYKTGDLDAKTTNQEEIMTLAAKYA